MHLLTGPPPGLRLAAALAVVGCAGDRPDPVRPDVPGVSVVDVQVDDTDATDEPEPEPDRYAHPNKLDQAALFTCADPDAPRSSPARIRRLTRREWARTIGSSPSSSTVGANPLDPPASLLYSSYPQDVTLDATTLDLFLSFSNQGAKAFADRTAFGRQHYTYSEGSLRCMWNDASPSEACIDHWVDQLLQRGVLFRPPLPEEHDAVVALVNTGLARQADSGASRADTLRHVTAATWLMSGALFRDELGYGAPDEHGRYRLGDWELAQSLSYMVSERAAGTPGAFTYGAGSPEDPNWSAPLDGWYPELQQAAADGTIQDPAVIRAFLREHAAGIDPGRQDLNPGEDSRRRANRAEHFMGRGIERFFFEWLEVDGFTGTFHDTPSATSAVHASGSNDLISSTHSSYNNLKSGYYAHEPVMLDQLSDTIARVVVEDEDVFGRLMTTRNYFLASTTPYETSSSGKSLLNSHRVYGLEDGVGDGVENQWVQVPAEERAGVLTHPAWLGSHSDAFEDGPSLIHRGKWMREKLFCQYVEPLELVMVEAQLLPSDGSKSARARVVESIEAKGAECMVCHKKMNSLGYPFESFNHTGFTRAVDHGPVDGSTDIDNLPDEALNGHWDAPVPFLEAVSQSRYAKRCFIRQTFRYFAGRDETMADQCTLSAMEQAYDESGGSFLALVETLATSDTHLYRHIPEDQEDGR